MKPLLLLSLLFLPVLVHSQRLTKLEKAKKNATLSEGEAIIYGTFIQRLGFSSGSLPQDIWLQDTATDKIYTFRVKPTYKSRKDNDFCVYIPPATYRILVYMWSRSEPLGSTTYRDPITKNYTATKLREMRWNQQSLPEDMEYYYFSIAPNTINYMGTWNFDEEPIFFKNERQSIEDEMQSEHTELDFAKAVTNIPD